MWTVFEHQFGDNETGEDAPGRGGYTTVLVPLPAEEAVCWWEDEYGEDPTRDVTREPYGQVWGIEEYADPEKARAQCGELELDAGGIGSPMTRHYTWDELQGRLDVRVVGENEV